MINSVQIYSTGNNFIMPGSPIQIIIPTINFKFICMQIGSSFRLSNNNTFTLEISESRDQYSSLPVFLDGYGNAADYYGSYYDKKNKKPIFVINKNSHIIVTFNCLGPSPDMVGLSLIGYHVDANGHFINTNNFPTDVMSKL